MDSCFGLCGKFLGLQVDSSDLGFLQCFVAPDSNKTKSKKLFDFLFLENNYPHKPYGVASFERFRNLEALGRVSLYFSSSLASCVRVFLDGFNFPIVSASQSSSREKFGRSVEIDGSTILNTLLSNILNTKQNGIAWPL